MTIKLSMKQIEALKKLGTCGEWESAYGLQESLSTLNLLAKRGLAEKKAELGYMFSPRNGLMYKITDAGRQWLATEKIVDAFD